MLSILYSDFKQFGCPNCGCDSAKGSPYGNMRDIDCLLHI